MLSLMAKFLDCITEENNHNVVVKIIKIYNQFHHLHLGKIIVIILCDCSNTVIPSINTIQ